MGRVIASATAIASIAAGVIHISAAADHENLPVMMVGFLIVATLQVGLGGLLIWRRPSRLLIGAALALMLSSLALWLVSRTVGLPFLEGGHMEPIGFKDGVTVLFELASVPGLLLLLSRELSGFALPSPRLGTQTVGMLGAAAFALLMPAFIADGGAHHSHDEAVAMGIHDDEHAHGAGEEHADADAAAHTDAGGHAHGDDGGGKMADADHHGEGASGSGHTDHVEDGEELASRMSGSGGHDHGAGAPRQAAGHHGPASGQGGDGDGHPHGDGDEHGGGEEQAGDDHGHGGGGGGGEQGGNDHDSGNDGGDQGGDHGHGGGGEQGGDDHDSGDDGGDQGGDSPGAVSAGYAPAEPATDGEPARGSQIFVRTGEEKKQEADHNHSSEPCNPTPEQRAAADALVSQTRESLKKYDNNPARALADGYEIAFRGAGTPDRFLHMFSAQHVYDTPGLPKPSAVEEEGEPVILDPNRIESFMYAMTDQGLTAIGGMYMMPAEYNEATGDLLKPRPPFDGPQMGGCLTRWHDHPDLGRMTNRSGAPTPQMLHVWTYPGLEPFREYNGREMSQLWQVGSLIPDISVPIRPAMITEILLNPDG